jgi:hypothetical protein
MEIPSLGGWTVILKVVCSRVPSDRGAPLFTSLGGWTVILKVVCSRVPSDRGAPLFNLLQREAEGERSPSHAKSRPALAELCHESASSRRVTP